MTDTTPTGPDAGAIFYHGTRADVAVGDLLHPGRASNHGDGAPLRIVGELESWTPHPPDVLQAMKNGLARLKAEGKDVIID